VIVEAENWPQCCLFCPTRVLFSGTSLVGTRQTAALLTSGIKQAKGNLTQKRGMEQGLRFSPNDGIK